MLPPKYEHTHAHKEEEETELFVATVHCVGDRLIIIVIAEIREGNAICRKQQFFHKKKKFFSTDVFLLEGL